MVVGVDGSEPSLRAVDWAADEAALRGVPLRVVYASLWEHYEGTSIAEGLAKPDEQVLAEDIVDTAARRARLRRPELDVRTEVLTEEPEYAQCPMVVVRGTHDKQAQAGTYGRIVVGVGEKPAGSAAVRFAFDEARRRGVPVEAVRAWRWPAREATDDALTAGEPARLHEQLAVEALDAAFQDVPADVASHRRTVEGPTRSVLVDASRDADLLVVGARRRPGHFGLQLGRVAHGVLHHSVCPVAIVPEKG